MITLHYYSRQGCHLCDAALESLLPVLRGRAQVEVRDIDSCEQWRSAFNERVPVIELDGVVIAEYPFDHTEVIQSIAEMPEN